ncbi:MAG TPA: ribonuclease R, partial [Gammaproteobacteria bacterium]|nr:ribonuclease R [Gammaproteobacteria bacterium]
AMVCWMDVSADGEITDYRFEPALIHSHSRLTYNQVWQFLEQGVDLPVGDKSAPDVIASLLQLDQLYRALDHARQRRGALDFDSREVQVVMDDRGSVEQLAAVQRNRAHKIIEECMVAANRCAAEWLDELKIPTLHRAHDRPDGEKIIALRQTLGALQLKLEGDEQPTTHQISRLLCSLEGRADGTMIQMMVLRSLKQAVYTPAVAGHFGMGLEHYTHFTSPIRRYPDLLVHRAL